MKKEYNTLLERYNKGSEMLIKEPTNQEYIDGVVKLQEKLAELSKKIGNMTDDQILKGFTKEEVEVEEKTKTKKPEPKKTEPNEMLVVYEVDGNEVQLTPNIVQEYIVGNNAKITMSEFKFFTELCKARKLNPFLKEAYLIKYKEGQPASIVVGKDAIYKRAILNNKFNGIESGVIVLNRDNEVIERKGSFKLDEEVLVGAWAKVHRKDWEFPTYVSVSFSEVSQKKFDGSLNNTWSTKSATMVEKVAKVRALRETFIEDLAGMYEEEEYAVTNNEDLKIVSEIPTTGIVTEDIL